MRIIIAIFSVLLIVSCSKKVSDKSILSTNNLPTQLFTIDITKDTTVTTANAATITIPQGTLVSNDNVVQLEFKEAYSLQQMILAGLSTITTDGKVLQSGGMFYIAPIANQNVTITKPIAINVPTEKKVVGMKLFTAKDTDGKLTWEKPFPFKVNSNVKNGIDGKALFLANCAQCHSIYKDGTGPALANMGRNRSKWYLRTFTNNWQEAVEAGDCQALKIQNYSTSQMNDFYHFSDAEIDAIYEYLNVDSLYVDDGVKAKQEYCQEQWKINKRLAELKDKRNGITKQPLIREVNKDTTPIVPIIAIDSIVNLVEKVEPVSEYYEVEITSFGWYNIDILLNEGNGVAEASVKVPIITEYKEYIKTYLVLPNRKIKIDAHLKEDNYVFGKTDDKLLLSINEEAYILAIGEKDKQFIYAKIPFTTALANNIPLQIKVASIYEFNADIRRMGWTGLDIKATAAKSAGALQTIDYEIEKIQKMKPKEGCDCGLNK